MKSKFYFVLILIITFQNGFASRLYVNNQIVNLSQVNEKKLYSNHYSYNSNVSINNSILGNSGKIRNKEGNRYLGTVFNYFKPLIEIDSITDITNSTATIHVSVITDGRSKISERGIILKNDFGEEFKFISSTENNSFSIKITSELDCVRGLNSKKERQYSVRAYLLSNMGISNSEWVLFKTNPKIPLITTVGGAVSNDMAFSGGHIYNKGGYDILSRGMVWSKSPLPTILDNKIEDGDGFGSFNTTIHGLEPNTEYYLRAFASNSDTTVYGQERKIKTTKVPNTVKDLDGNIYHIIQIGDQFWMRENLKTSWLNDGTAIPYVMDQEAWEETKTYAWVYYDNDEKYGEKYGKLYNWYSVESGKLCPTGWHIPSKAEWEKLIKYIHPDDEIARYKLLSGEEYINILDRYETLDYDSPINEYGFTGYLAGQRTWMGFENINMSVEWWTSTTHSERWRQNLTIEISNENSFELFRFSKNDDGLPVRCIKD